MSLEYVIYCDESEEKGRYYSNFYGGVLVPSTHLEEIGATIAARKAELNFSGEVKWSKITEAYSEKYIELMDTFFDFVRGDKLKVRIMFTQNRNIPKGLTKRHIDEKYFILYYQFIKHAFGLQCSPHIDGGVRVRVYPDKIPDTAEKVEQFRSFIVGLSRNPALRRRNIQFHREDVADVDSHDHDILQCLDVVLGAMHFRMNNKHLEKTASNGRRRGKRTKAKERVYKHINRRVRDIYPNFNIGVSTGQPEETSRWDHPYRHWLFEPRERVVVDISKKKKKKETP